MPLYLFQHPKTEEVIEVIQKMTEPHVYTDEEGTKWNRIFTSPNASIDTQNDGTHEGFMKYTQNKKGTIGELWDASREASEKRNQEQGHDPVKEKHMKNYSKKRRGMKHKDSGGGLFSGGTSGGTLEV
jgi:hypothetical protein|tara:strand:- start:324 stop:707 length:384 start_codon:yes stop_codon:yes gene_type:complete